MERLRGSVGARIEGARRATENTINYPSADIVEANLYATGLTTIGSIAAMREGMPLQYGIPILAGSVAAEAYLFKTFVENMVDITDYVYLTKAANYKPKTLKDGSRIAFGDKVVDLHVYGVDKIPWLKDKKPLQRAALVAQAGLEGMMDLASYSANLHPYLDDVNYFRAQSWLVQPKFFEELGFEVQRDIRFIKSPLKFKDLRRYERILGHPVESYHEAWIRKDRLVDSYALLEEHRDRLARFTREDRVSTPLISN